MDVGVGGPAQSEDVLVGIGEVDPEAVGVVDLAPQLVVFGVADCSLCGRIHGDEHEAGGNGIQRHLLLGSIIIVAVVHGRRLSG